MVDLGIVILNYNTKELTQNCLRSLLKHPPKTKYEVWLVDNASSDGSVEAIRKSFPQVHIVVNKVNSGFASGNNLVLKKIYKQCRYCLLLNTDTIILPGAFDGLLNFAERAGYGITTCRLLFPNRSFQANVGSLPSLMPVLSWLTGLDDIFRKVMAISSYHQESKLFYTREREVGWISGSVMLISQSVFRKIGFLDEKIFMYGEDVDYCLRAHRSGFKLGWTDQAEIIHIGGASSDKPRLKQWTGEFKGLLYVYKKHYGALASFALRLLSYLFITIRALAFLVIGKVEHAKTYAQVLVSI